jgi:hypothetical protein
VNRRIPVRAYVVPAKGVRNDHYDVGAIEHAGLPYPVWSRNHQSQP